MGTAEHFKKAIELAEDCKPENQEKPHPRVGAVIVDAKGKVVAGDRRGGSGKEPDGDHAELHALRRAKSSEPTRRRLDGATVFTTLEPCTRRNEPNRSCTAHLLDSRIAAVYVGILDPNPVICGRGISELARQGISVQLFPRHYAEKVRAMNRAFIDSFLDLQRSDPYRTAPFASFRLPQDTRVQELVGILQGAGERVHLGWKPIAEKNALGVIGGVEDPILYVQGKHLWAALEHSGDELKLFLGLRPRHDVRGPIPHAPRVVALKVGVGLRDVARVYRERTGMDLQPQGHLGFSEGDTLVTLRDGSWALANGWNHE
jgi:pyrimidine deaminase RibD-like protein